MFSNATAVAARRLKSHPTTKGEMTMAAAEALGWATVDKTKPKDQMDVFCPFCQERARRIVKTIGLY